MSASAVGSGNVVAENFRPVVGQLVDPGAHGLALEHEAVGVVHQAVEDGVGVGGVADHVMPAIDRQLGGDDGRGPAVPVVDHGVKGGRLHLLRNVLFAASAKAPVKAAVFVREKNMKDSWCLASNQEQLSGHALKKLYSRRWTIEPGFRDLKDLRFGMGLGDVRISEPTRRDRLLLANAVATMILTILGEAAEAIGLDRKHKVNTVKRRTPFPTATTSCATSCAG